LQNPSPAGGMTRGRDAPELELFTTLVFLVPPLIRVRPEVRVKRILASPVSSLFLAL
jgi:hypothetical protein